MCPATEQSLARPGFPGGARLVVRISGQSHGLPWHRVVAAGGRIAIPGEGGLDQRFRLEMEGVKFSGKKVRMAEFEYKFHGRKRRSRRNKSIAEKGKKQPRIKAKNADHNLVLHSCSFADSRLLLLNLRPSAEICWRRQRSYAAAGDMDLCAAWLMNFFITLAHITFLRTALSFTVRPWANIPSSAFILNTRRMAASDWLTL